MAKTRLIERGATPLWNIGTGAFCLLNVHLRHSSITAVNKKWTISRSSFLLVFIRCMLPLISLRKALNGLLRHNSTLPATPTVYSSQIQNCFTKYTGCDIPLAQGKISKFIIEWRTAERNGNPCDPTNPHCGGLKRQIKHLIITQEAKFKCMGFVSSISCYHDATI